MLTHGRPVRVLVRDALEGGEAGAVAPGGSPRVRSPWSGTGPDGGVEVGVGQSPRPLTLETRWTPPERGAAPVGTGRPARGGRRAPAPATGRRHARERGAVARDARRAHRLHRDGVLVAGDRRRRRLSGPTRWFRERSATWWDSFHFLRIVDRGYLSLAKGGGTRRSSPATRSPSGPSCRSPRRRGDGRVRGVRASLDTVAAAVLWHLGRLATGSERGGRAAVLVLAAAPYGFFLVTVYSEALFLACALGAWRSRPDAALVGGGAAGRSASGVRINGIFLAVALLVLYLQQARGDRRAGVSAGVRAARAGPAGCATDVLALALPLVAVGGYFAYLRGRTGTWNAWQTAQDIGLAPRHGGAVDRHPQRLGERAVGRGARPRAVALGRPRRDRRGPRAARRAARVAALARGGVRAAQRPTSWCTRRRAYPHRGTP